MSGPGGMSSLFLHYTNKTHDFLIQHSQSAQRHYRICRDADLRHPLDRPYSP